jgi:hypothetical protein
MTSLLLLAPKPLPSCHRSAAQVHHKQWQQLAVGALVEVQLKTEPNELVFGCVDLVNGVLGVERDHPLQGEDQFLHFDQLEQVYEGQPRWDPSTGKWLAEWALVAEVGRGMGRGAGGGLW